MLTTGLFPKSKKKVDYFFISSSYPGAPHRARLGQFPSYQIFLIKMSFFIILFRIWKWVSSSILNSKYNSETYFSHSYPFASIWCKGQKTTTFDYHNLLEHFSFGRCNAMTSYTNLICKSNILFISVVCRRLSLPGEAVR